MIIMKEMRSGFNVKYIFKIPHLRKIIWLTMLFNNVYCILNNKTLLFSNYKFAEMKLRHIKLFP